VTAGSLKEFHDTLVTLSHTWRKRSPFRYLLMFLLSLAGDSNQPRGITPASEQVRVKGVHEIADQA